MSSPPAKKRRVEGNNKDEAHNPSSYEFTTLLPADLLFPMISFADLPSLLFVNKWFNSHANQEIDNRYVHLLVL